MFENHSKVTEASRTATGALSSCIVSNKQWMSVVFGIKEDGSLVCNRTTWDFPKGKMAEALFLLACQFAEESKSDLLPDNPLPRAKLEKQHEEPEYSEPSVVQFPSAMPDSNVEKEEEVTVNKEKED